MQHLVLGVCGNPLIIYIRLLLFGETHVEVLSRCYLKVYGRGATFTCGGHSVFGVFVLCSHCITRCTLSGGERENKKMFAEGTCCAFGKSVVRVATLPRMSMLCRSYRLLSLPSRSADVFHSRLRQNKITAVFHYRTNVHHHDLLPSPSKTNLLRFRLP